MRKRLCVRRNEWPAPLVSVGVIVRRLAALVLVVAVAAGAGIAARELRASRAQSGPTTEEPSNEVAAAPPASRVPPTAASFVPAAPAKPGTRDPFADIRALPRIDQMTGGALTVVSRTATAKRVSSPDGGWSVKVPSDWRADVGRLRGGELYSFDPTGMDFDRYAPPPGGVRMSVMLW